MNIVTIQSRNIVSDNLPEYAIDYDKISLVRKSMKYFGQLVPIFADPNFNLYDGYCRLAAAFELNIEELKAIIVPTGTDYTEIVRLRNNYFSEELSVLQTADAFHDKFLEHYAARGSVEDEYFGALNEFAYIASSDLELSEDEIKKLISISEGISPALKELCCDLSADSNLSLLEKASNLSIESQLYICNTLVDGAEFNTLIEDLYNADCA